MVSFLTAFRSPPPTKPLVAGHDASGAMLSFPRCASDSSVRVSPTWRRRATSDSAVNSVGSGRQFGSKLRHTINASVENKLACDTLYQGCVLVFPVGGKTKQTERRSLTIRSRTYHQIPFCYSSAYAPTHHHGAQHGPDLLYAWWAPTGVQRP